MVLRKYNNEVDLRYFYYCLTNQPFLDMLQRKAENRIGSFPQITFDLLSEYAFPVPSLSEQEKIANIIFSLEHKIELNKQINDNLEAMAKQLYEYWFVQFDFPNEEGKPYKSSGGAMVWNEKLKREIPQGWNNLPISDILDKYPTTKRYETKEYLQIGKYPIIDQGDAYIVGFTNENDNLLTRHPAVLFGDHSTKVKFLDFDFARGADGTQILYSSNDAVSQYYLYLVVSALQIPNPGYSRHFKYLKELPIVIPSLSIATKFVNIVKPLFEKWTKNIFNNIALTKQRDELLPLLMNGQASVNYHLSASTCISFDISVLFLNFTNGNSLYETISLDYQCFALPLHSKENTHGNIQDDKRHIQQRQRQGDKHARERFLAFFYKCTSTVHQAAFGNAWCYRGYKGKVISESK